MSHSNFLPAPRYFWATNNGPVGFLTYDMYQVIPLFRSIPDAEEWTTAVNFEKVSGYEVPYQVKTVRDLQTLFGWCEELYTHVVVNPPPNSDSPMEIIHVDDYFDLALEESYPLF